jgi:hypothetical protein
VEDGMNRSCAQCGEQISAIRLKAKPNARHCVRCQETRDVIITANRVISAFAVQYEKFQTEADEVCGVVSTCGLSAHIRQNNRSDDKLEHSKRASNTGLHVFSAAGRMARAVA